MSAEMLVGGLMVLPLVLFVAYLTYDGDLIDWLLMWGSVIALVALTVTGVALLTGDLTFGGAA